MPVSRRVSSTRPMTTHQKTSARGARSVAAEHLWPLVGLSVTSLVGGLLEALFLVGAARAAFSITDGSQSVTLFAGWSVSIGLASLVLLLIVVLRVGFALGTLWQSSRLGAIVTAELRSRLGTAFLRASWTAQHGERTGRLQELLTTYSQQGSSLINSVMQLITSSVTLFALLVSAVVVDPLASAALIVAVVILGSVLRPLRNAVRRQARRTASTGMEFATSLSEISQLGMEMHVFNVQPQTEQRLDRLISGNAVAARRLAFLSGMVPVMYSGLVYVALVGGLAIVAAIGTTNITSVGAIMLIMLRSLSYGQNVQTSSAVINSAVPFLESFNDEVDRFESARLVESRGARRSSRVTLTC